MALAPEVPGSPWPDHVASYPLPFLFPSLEAHCSLHLVQSEPLFGESPSLQLLCLGGFRLFPLPYLPPSSPPSDSLPTAVYGRVP